jgi:hypothetical protein
MDYLVDRTSLCHYINQLKAGKSVTDCRESTIPIEFSSGTIRKTTVSCMHEAISVGSAQQHLTGLNANKLINILHVYENLHNEVRNFLDQFLSEARSWNGGGWQKATT